MEWQSECYPATAAAPDCHSNWGRKSEPFALSLLAFFFSFFFGPYSGSHLMILSFSGMFFCLSVWFTQYFAPSDPCCVHVQAYIHQPLQKLFTLNLPLALQSFVSTSSWESNDSAACREHSFHTSPVLVCTVWQDRELDRQIFSLWVYTVFLKTRELTINLH